MTIFGNLFKRAIASDVRDASDDRFFGAMHRPTASAVHVTPDTALNLPVVWDCLNVLSDTIAALPLHVYQRGSNGSKRVEDQHPLHTLLHDDFELRKQQIWDLAQVGNFFAENITNTAGITTELRWMPPNETTVQRLRDGSVRYRTHDDGGSTRTLVEGEVWHIRRPPLLNRGLVGTSPIEVGREVIGTAIAVQDYAARFFGNDCTPPFVLEHPANFADQTSRTNFLQAIKRWWGGANRHSPAVLEYGIKLNRVGVNNEEAQFLETRKELDYAVTRLWRMPPHKVGLLERATNNNIEHQSLEFVMDTLLPWLTMIEKAMLRDLMPTPGQFFAEHNVAGLLRGDLKGRYQAYAAARQWGWLSVNDIRRLENMNPIAAGDAYLQPLNMVPAGSASGEPDAKLFDQTGAVVSQLFGENWTRPETSFTNIVNIEDYRHAA